LLETIDFDFVTIGNERGYVILVIVILLLMSCLVMGDGQLGTELIVRERKKVKKDFPSNSILDAARPNLL
jgi:hypothetical protein